MTTEQKLREALQAVIAAHDACMRELGEQMRAANITNFRVDGQAVIDSFAAIEQARQALATTAPDMPLSMNQFGRLVELTREHLLDNTFVYKATSKTGDTCHFGVESAAKAWAKGGTVEAIKVRDFKLHTSVPTADHLPDAGKMVETAEPVAEREAFEKWLGIKPCGAAHDFGWAAWQARAAMAKGVK